MRIDLVSWDLEAGGMGVHQTRYGLVIDGVFYELPHRSRLKARNDLRAALELAGVDFDKGRPDALEQQIDATRRKIEAKRDVLRELGGQRVGKPAIRLAKLFDEDVARMEAHLAHLEGQRP